MRSLNQMTKLYGSRRNKHRIKISYKPKLLVKQDKHLFNYRFQNE